MHTTCDHPATGCRRDEERAPIVRMDVAGWTDSLRRGYGRRLYRFISKVTLRFLPPFSTVKMRREPSRK
jgi:hypothetical protein